MSFDFRPARRENVPLLIGVAGGTGSGKTYSALRLAKGLAAGKRFAIIDTEAGRAKHYADDFEFDHGDLRPPFRPDAYAAAIAAADTAGYPVVVVDSTSHEHAGDGGLLDMQQAEYQRMGGRDNVKMASWIRPKFEHKRFVSKLLQLRNHLILCFRAEEKVEMVKDPDGKWQVVPKQTKTGLDGWVPITEKNLPYELTLSFLLTADQPGVPRPIKLQEQHRALVPLDQPISEETGRRLAEWAAGAGEARPVQETAASGLGDEAPDAPPADDGPAPSPFHFQPADGDKAPLPITRDELKDLLRLEQVSRQKAQSIRQKLFPGRPAETLTDQEHGELWAAIKRDLETVMF